MPEPNEFAKGFGIYNSMIFHGYQLESFHIDHIPIQKYKKYEYHTTLIFKWIENSTPTNENINQFLTAFSTLVSLPKKIYTRYGNPYLCFFSKQGEYGNYVSKNSGKEIILYYIGYSERI